jgi:hypothetical protein
VRSGVTRLIETTGEVCLDDGKCNFFRRSAGRSPARSPIHSACRRYALAETHYWGPDCLKIAGHPANVSLNNIQRLLVDIVRRINHDPGFKGAVCYYGTSHFQQK